MSNLRISIGFLFTFFGVLFFSLVTVSPLTSFFAGISSPSLCWAREDQSTDETYDPFSDYSEYEETGDEEADINFFRHGRFLTIGLGGGLRGFTNTLTRLYANGPTYGLDLTYFFDFRFAFSMGFNTGDYNFSLNAPPNSMHGNVALTFLHGNLKYYLNTQNVTRGLADLNPYLLGGFSQVYRTYTISGEEDFSKDSVVGCDLGGGLEVPLLRRKAFFGGQVVFHYLPFSDRNSNIHVEDANHNLVETSAKPNGDSYDLQAILGFNF